MSVSVMVLALTLSACIEYRPGARPGETDESTPERVEVCNGLDDDGDGRRDEGFDDDGDATADCLQCAVAPSEGARAAPASCEIPSTPPADDPWDVVPAWDHVTAEWSGGCRVTSVGDVDGDGDVEVICASARLEILDGATGRLEATMPAEEIELASPTVLADVDGDCASDMLYVAADVGRIVALRSDGTEMWQSNADVAQQGIYPSEFGVADLDGDGAAEVFTPFVILRAADAGQLWRYADPIPTWLPLDATIADVDGDGVLEVAAGWRAYDVQGEILWDTPQPDTWTGVGVTTVVVNADADDEPELAWISDKDYLLVDGDGSVLASAALEGTQTYSAGCAGDLDGDGSPEVVWSDREWLHARSPDGAPLWKVPFEDTSLYVACTTFDFDLDGADEVVIAGIEQALIVDGRTGATLWSEPRYSATWHDEPIVADLDGDGSVEILISKPDGGRYGYPADLDVYSHATGGWPPGLPFWSYSAWSGTGVWPDGQVDRKPEPYWTKYGHYRAQPEAAVYGRDLRPEIVSSCAGEVDADDAEVRLAVRVANGGPQDTCGTTPVAVYALDEQGDRVLIDTLSFSEAIPTETYSATLELVTTRGVARNGLVLVAGWPDDTAPRHYDCDPTNNEIAWSLP